MGDEKTNSAVAVSTTTAALWLLIWTLNNIAVTLINKAAFATVHFPYPYTLSAIHMIFCMLGTSYLFWCLDRDAYLSIVAQKSNVDTTTTATATTTTRTTTNTSTKDIENNDDSRTDDDEDISVRSNPSRSRSKTIHTTMDNNNNNNNINSNNVIIQLLDSMAIGVSNILGGGTIVRPVLEQSGQRMLYMFSIIFTLNIAIGNVSLQYVSINFNQIVRSLIPALTMWMGMIFLNKKVSTARQYAVLPVVFGVAMSCYGDRMSYTTLGLFYTVLCTVLASVKVVASGEMLTGQCKLHPVDLLHRMAPPAFLQCTVLALFTGELQSIYHRWDTEFNPFVTVTPFLVVSLSGVLAFSLNITALQAYKVTSPLTCCIVAAVKQVLTIWAGTVMFHTPITTMNGLGIIIVLLASTRYSYIAVIESIPNSSSSFSSSTSSTPLSSSGKDIESNNDVSSSTSNTNTNDDDDNELIELLKETKQLSPTKHGRS